MTSLFLISSNESAKCSAAEPLFTATHSSEPTYFLNASSKIETLPIPRPEDQK